MTLATNVSIQLKANGTDVSTAVDWASLDLTLVLTKEASRLKFMSKRKAGRHQFIVGDTIDFYETTNPGSVTAHLFGGTVTEVETTAKGLLLYDQVTVTDWQYQMNGKLVVKSYVNMDPGDIVADIITNYCPAGFDTTTYLKRTGYTVPSMKFNYQQPTKAIQSIASQIGWEWYVDADKKVHFFLAENSTAPFAIDDTTAGINWTSLDVDINLQNMKNSVFVIGGVYPKVFTQANEIDVYVADGIQKSWPLFYAYTPATIVIKKNGVTLGIGVANQVTDESLYGVIYDQSNKYIKFPITPNASDLIEVYGTAEVPIIAHAMDQGGINTYGEFQDAIFDAHIKSIAEAQMRAQAEIQLYGHAVYDVKFDTVTPGLRVGQTILFNSATYGVSNYPLTIKRIQGKGRRMDQLIYSVECVGSDNVTFTDLITTMLNQTNTSTTVDNTTLELLLLISETLTLTDTLSQPTSNTPPYKYTSGSPVGVYNLSTWS